MSAADVGYPSDAGAIVVGVDFDGDCGAALRWAVSEGALRRCPVRAIAVWSFPRLPPTRRGVTLVTFPAPEELELELTETLATRVRDAVGEADVERRLVRTGDLDAMLADAALLVLADGRLGFVTDLVTGSARRALLQRATCPVVLVP